MTRNLGFVVATPQPGVAAARRVSPVRSATSWKILRVRLAVPDLGLTYADDAEQNRYFFDRDSVVETPLEVGRDVMAEVDDAGYASRTKALAAE